MTSFPLAGFDTKKQGRNKRESNLMGVIKVAFLQRSILRLKEKEGEEAN